MEDSFAWLIKIIESKLKGEKIFFIVGAQRCGTSLLAQAFDRLPEVRMAKPLFPEPKFFLNPEESRKGKEYYLRKFFEGRMGSEWLGEKSTSYIESKAAAENIKQLFPEAKIIISLRNPVERAISNYYFSKANKLETRSPEDVFLENRALNFDQRKFSVSPFDYLKRGEYINYIKDYVAFFGKENVLVLLFEKLIKEKKEWEKISNFLKINPILPDLTEKVNERLIQEDISLEVIEQLKSYFRDFNKELEAYLKIDLSIWNIK